MLLLVIMLSALFMSFSLTFMRSMQFTISSATSFYFLLERDGRVFDMAEMSSGEQ